MYASIFGNLTAIIQRLYSRTSRFHRDLRTIEDFVRFYKIPKSTKEELDEYFRHEWAYTRGVDMETVRQDKCIREAVVRLSLCIHQELLKMGKVWVDG